jgi:ribosomal protein S18 acetylase RimI-like enzyme
VTAAYSPYVERIGKPPAPMLDDYDELIARGVVTVAELAGSVVGLIVMWDESDHVYVDNVATDPSVRRAGIGWALLSCADRRAGERGLSEVRLYTNAAMTENLGYYERLGFVETHRGHEAGFDRVYFTKRVPAGGQ